jgi:DNA-binding IclR family transcriptional regulator
VGTSNLKALSIEVGTRRPLITAAGGIAMLIEMGEQTSQAMQKNMKDVARFGGERVHALQEVLRESRKVGYGVHRGQIVPGVHALGLALTNSDGVPFASISIVGPAQKLQPAQIKAAIALMRDEIKALEHETDCLAGARRNRSA